MNADTLADEQACARLMLRTAYFADSHDIDGFVGLFAEDAEIQRPAGVASGREAIREAMAARPRSRMTRHLLTPPVVDVSAQGEAHGLSYFTMYDGPEAARDGKDEFPLAEPVVIGEYRQSYRRVGGEWLIALHRIIPVLRPRPEAAA